MAKKSKKRRRRGRLLRSGGIKATAKKKTLVRRLRKLKERTRGVMEKVFSIGLSTGVSVVIREDCLEL